MEDFIEQIKNEIDNEIVKDYDGYFADLCQELHSVYKKHREIITNKIKEKHPTYGGSLSLNMPTNCGIDQKVLHCIPDVIKKERLTRVIKKLVKE